MQLKGDGSINQFIVNAIAEKVSTLRTETYLQKQASHSSREHAFKILGKVADVPAEEYDRV